jgi:hypothetical protein
VDRTSLRDVILRKVNDGGLPTKAPNKIYTGYGIYATCNACGDPIRSFQVEYELNYPDEHCTFRLHLACAGLWEAVSYWPRLTGSTPAKARKSTM